MRALWKRLKVSLSRASRQTVTRGGLLFTLAVLLVGIAAVASANNLLFLILAAMLSTMLVSGFISRLSLSGLEMDFVLPEHVSARRKLTGRVFVRNTKRWIPSFSVHLAGTSENVLSTLYFPVIPGHAVLDEGVEICFDRRGLHRENSFQFSTSFPFGFLHKRADVTLRREVLVYPCVDPQAGFEDMLSSIRGDLEAYFRGRGHDFYRIRPYEALESARHVDWKATAHTGDLQVREFAREQDRLLEVFLDLSVEAPDFAWFDKAVDACAFLVWRVSEKGARIRFRTQEFDLSVPESGDVYAILRYLATVSHARGRPPIVPHDENSFQLVFTSRDPGEVADMGWNQARIFGPSSFSDTPSGPTGCR
jgi:uncharacterized protein (DUF58 family)